MRGTEQRTIMERRARLISFEFNVTRCRFFRFSWLIEMKTDLLEQIIRQRRQLPEQQQQQLEQRQRTMIMIER